MNSPAPALALAAAAALAALLLATPAAAAEPAAGEYRLVPERSTARLTVKSFVGTISARMPFRSARMAIGPGGGMEAASAQMDATRTGGAGKALDRQLKGPTGLDAANHPVIAFTATAAQRRADALVLQGDLTMKGVTRPVRFEGTMRVRDERRIVVHLEAEIDRTAFGVTAGRPVYSRKATVDLRLVMVRPRRR